MDPLPSSVLGRLLVIACCLLAPSLAARSQGFHSIEGSGVVVGYKTVNATYRVFNATIGANPSWTSTGEDILAGKKFNMSAVEDAKVHTMVKALNTPYGPLKVWAAPPLFSTDLKGADAVYPYCANKSSCVVATQRHPDFRPLELIMPGNVSAIDLYLDLMLDCRESSKAPKSLSANCTFSVLPQPFWPIPGKTGPFTVPVTSVCGKPDVGTYFGIYALTRVAQITQLTVSCDAKAPLLVAMLRVGPPLNMKEADEAEPVGHAAASFTA